MVAVEENEVTKKLAAWAAIFAVATLYSSVWGMNFKAMPELQWEYGYVTALLLMGITSVVLYYFFKRARWL